MQNEMKNYHNEAITILNEFKNNDANKAKLLLDYVINRKNDPSRNRR